MRVPPTPIITYDRGLAVDVVGRESSCTDDVPPPENTESDMVLAELYYRTFLVWPGNLVSVICVRERHMSVTRMSAATWSLL